MDDVLPVLIEDNLDEFSDEEVEGILAKLQEAERELEERAKNRH